MESLKIIHLPEGALSVMKDAITKEGEVLRRDSVIRGISGYLIFCEEPSVLWKISEFLCGEGALAERIFKRTLKTLSEDGDFSYRKRRDIIEKNLIDCLKITDRLDFDGFINFRLGEYINLLCRAVLISAFDCL